MTDTRITPREGVHYVRRVESPVETSAIDRRFDYVPAPRPRVIILRSTTHTEFVVTSAIDLRDDVLRDEVPGIVGDSCFGVLGAERDAVVQAIAQDDTQPVRRVSARTTAPEVQAIRDAAARGDVAAVRQVLQAASLGDGPDPLLDDDFTLALGRGSSPALGGAIAFARGSAMSLDAAAAAARADSTTTGGDAR